MRTAGTDVDLAVVGAGAAGCTAALVAAGAGLTVALLERDGAQPPTTALSGGWVFAAGTRYQAKAGIDDSPEALARDIQAKNGGEGDPALVRAICAVSAEVVHWLADEVGYPLRLAPEAGRVDDPDLPLRAHEGRHERGGAALMAALRAKARATEEIAWADPYPVRGLLCGDGAVLGVAGEGEEIRAGAVVLAAGGFGGSPALLERWCPAAAGLEYVGGPGATGEAIEWARELGAALLHMDAWQGHSQFVKGFGVRLSPGIPGEGGIFVDARGRRFAREDVNYSAFALELTCLPEREAVEIFDERVLDAVRDQELMRAAAAAAIYRRAETVEELAAQFGLDPGVLAETLGEYAAACREGRDRFGRVSFGQPLRPPYYAARVIPTLAHTQGGLAVSARMEVLREDGSPIPGLYAAGGTAVGLSGSGAAGYYSGNGLLAAFGGGLLAARAIGA